MKFWRISLLFQLIVLQSCNRASLQNNAIYSAIFHEVSSNHLHGPCMSPDYFKDVLQMIRLGNMQTVFASDAVAFLEEGCISPDLVALSFDDGWAGIHDFAHPLLTEFDMKATFFVATDSIEQGRPRYCSRDDLKELAATGRWEIQSHSVMHPDFVELNDSALRIELKDSLARIREKGFLNSCSIAYPYGHSNPQIERETQAAGYRAGFIAGANARIQADSNLFALPRTTLCQLYDQDLVCRKLGLDLNSIRRNLAIYDEDEGTWNDRWTHVKSDPGIPRGLYGDSYIKTQSPDAKWWIDVPIEEAGRYQFSIWTPFFMDKEGDVQTEETGFWRLFLLDGPFVDKGSIPSRTRNGWTILATVDCQNDAYRIELNPKLETCDLFIVDALKVERVN